MRVKQRLVLASAITILLLIVATLCVSYYISGMVLQPVTKDHDETFRLELEHGRLSQDYYNSLPKHDQYIQSPHGYRLHAVFIPKGSSKKTVILVHGRTYTLMGSFKYVEIFRSRGFNTLLVDNRYHGKSGGENSTYGYFERDDVKAWVDWMFENTGKDSLVGFHGESLGSVIGLMHMTVDNRVSFYVLDGAIASLTRTVESRLWDDYGIPAFPLIPLTSLMSMIQGGMSFDDISPIQFIGDIKIPVFFVHGEKDRYSSSGSSKQLFESHPGPKKLWICPEAGHSECVTANREAYDQKVGEFFERIGIN